MLPHFLGIQGGDGRAPSPTQLRRKPKHKVTAHPLSHTLFALNATTTTTTHTTTTTGVCMCISMYIHTCVCVCVCVCVSVCLCLCLCLCLSKSTRIFVYIFPSVHLPIFPICPSSETCGKRTHSIVREHILWCAANLIVHLDNQIYSSFIASTYASSIASTYSSHIHQSSPARNSVFTLTIRYIHHS